MKTTSVEEFYVIGLSVRTTVENGKVIDDVSQLWNHFLLNNIRDQIPNKVDDTIYRIYADYESDHTKPFTAIIGCRVNNLDNVPGGFSSKTIEGGKYMLMTAKGKPADGIVLLEWMKIWNARKIPRAYKADFEVYDEKAADPEQAEINIFVSLK
jgi:predicted transcriptional regulator YdeE